MQLGERLARLVPVGGVDVVELEDDGTCVRFNPLMTAAGKSYKASAPFKTRRGLFS